MSPIRLRPATLEDAPALAEIYRPHVLDGFGTFEEEPPSPAEMAARLRAVTAAGLPWLAAEAEDDGGAILGFAYAAPFRARPAYRVSAEDSIYVHPRACGRGVGRALLAELVALCTTRGLSTLTAVIGDSANHASIRLHAAAGFTHAGLLKAMACKHGRWLDVVLMQRVLNPRP